MPVAPVIRTVPSSQPGSSREVSSMRRDAGQPGDQYGPAPDRGLGLVRRGQGAEQGARAVVIDVHQEETAGGLRVRGAQQAP